LGAAAGCRGAGSGGACGPGRRRPWEIRAEEERLECDAMRGFVSAIGRSSEPPWSLAGTLGRTWRAA
jgi:hypothetical protein